MNTKKPVLVWIQVVVVLGAVFFGSMLSVQLWGGKTETAAASDEIIINNGMTIAQFGKANRLPKPMLKKMFGLQQPTDFQKMLDATGYAKQELVRRAKKIQAIGAEKATKNWKKILVKFILWIGFLIMCGVLLGKRKVKTRMRIALYSGAVLVFGVILGADPAPMGTVKDAIVLFGKERVVFPPRMIALGAFLLMTIIANKFICSWGCQLGALQDLLFRFNRTSSDKPVLRQFKIPFVVTNTVRVLFFIMITSAAFIWAFDIVEPFDPFKIFKPGMLGAVGMVVVGVLLLFSVFAYRPWCHFFCPFGLVGWVGEKVAFRKISVDYDTCIACGACVRACPSTVMQAILTQKKVAPDCFSCGSCIEACPRNAVAFSSRKRKKPPDGKFDSMK